MEKETKIKEQQENNISQQTKVNKKAPPTILLFTKRYVHYNVTSSKPSNKLKICLV